MRNRQVARDGIRSFDAATGAGPPQPAHDDILPGNSRLNRGRKSEHSNRQPRSHRTDARSQHSTRSNCIRHITTHYLDTSPTASKLFRSFAQALLNNPAFDFPATPTFHCTPPHPAVHSFIAYGSLPGGEIIQGFFILGQGLHDAGNPVIVSRAYRSSWRVSVHAAATSIVEEQYQIRENRSTQQEKISDRVWDNSNVYCTASSLLQSSRDLHFHVIDQRTTRECSFFVVVASIRVEHRVGVLLRLTGIRETRKRSENLNLRLSSEMNHVHQLRPESQQPSASSFTLSDRGNSPPLLIPPIATPQ